MSTNADRLRTPASGLDDHATESRPSENRFIAMVLLIAGVSTFLFVALHGQVESDSDTLVFLDNFVAHVAAQDSWGAAQTLRIVAYLSWMVGFVALMRQSAADNKPRRIAGYTSPLLVLGTGLWLMHIAAEFGTYWLVTAHADAPLRGFLEMATGLRLIDVGILAVAGVTYWLSLVGVGLNVLSSPYPKWYGWSLIGVSAPPAAASILLGITSTFILINIIVLFSVALALWSLIVGFALLRRRDHIEPATSGVLAG